MEDAGRDREDWRGRLQTLQSSSATVHRIATALIDTLGSIETPARSAFLIDSRPDPVPRWEDGFARAMVAKCLAATDALWAAARVLDGKTEKVRRQAVLVAGSQNGASNALGSLLPIEKAALQKGCRCSATSEECRSEFGEQDSPLATTRSIVALPLTTHYGHEALLTVGFGENSSNGNNPRNHALGEFVEGCSVVLTAHRRIETLRTEALEPLRRAGRSLDACALVENAPFSFTLLSGDNGKPGCGYAASAFRPNGEARLFASRIGMLGIGGTWEKLALDLLFRAVCLACTDASEVADLWARKILPILPAADCRFRFCCADLSESGRDYRYIGEATHLVYENCTQMVEELTHSAAAGRDGPNGRVRALHLHSGDIVLLHLCYLPTILTERHAMQRRLSGVLAMRGRTDIQPVSREVASILREACSCPEHAPGLILLRSE